MIKELRLLCRDEVALICDRTALITQLRQSLYDYYPAALEAFDDWTMPAARAFIIAFPTPEVLAKAGKRKWETFLNVHTLARPATYQRRLENLPARMSSPVRQPRSAPNPNWPWPAPGSYQSGQIHRVYLRRQCNKSLRNVLHLWANLSREFCPWAATYFAALRAKGKSRACAPRALGQRWLKIFWKMWHTRTLYDTDLHARNQCKHGSWVLQLVNQPVVVKT